MKPKVIFIDWYGTLSRSNFWERWQVDPRQHSKYSLISDALFDDNKLMDDWMRGLVSTPSILSYLSKMTKLPYDDLFNELKYSAENMKFVDDSILDIVKKIRDTGIKVVISTDNMDPFSRWTIPSLKLEDHFDDVIVSVDRGALKIEEDIDGSSKFFTHYFHSTNTKPEESLLIDDSIKSKMVENFGMNYLQVTKDRSLFVHLNQFVNI